MKIVVPSELNINDFDSKEEGKINRYIGNYSDFENRVNMKLKKLLKN